MDFRGELLMLKSHCKQQKDKVRKSVGIKEQQSRDSLNKHEASIQARKEEFSQYQNQIKSVQTAAAAQNQCLKAKVAKLEELKAELEKAEDQRKIELLTEDQDRKCVDQVETEIAHIKDELGQNTAVKQKLQHVEAACKKFEDMFGLTLKKTKGNRMQVVFTQIDEKEPEKPFYFFLTISNDRTYVVSDPEPVVEGFPELTEKLNETQNISAFFVAVRRKFKMSVKSVN